MKTTITTPKGMSGIVTQAWGDTYAVAAKWSEASSPVLMWTGDAWVPLPWGAQVADYTHDATGALRAILRDAASAGGDIDEDEIDKMVSRSEDI